MSSRGVLATNVRALLRARKEAESGAPHSQAAVARDARKRGIALSQTGLSKIMRESNAATIDALDALAAYFGLRPFQLLIPGLDPHDLAVVVSNADTRRLIRRITGQPDTSDGDGGDGRRNDGASDRVDDDRPHDGRRSGPAGPSPDDPS